MGYLKGVFTGKLLHIENVGKTSEELVTPMEHITPDNQTRGCLPSVGLAIALSGWDCIISGENIKGVIPQRDFAEPFRLRHSWAGTCKIKVIEKT